MPHSLTAQFLRIGCPPQEHGFGVPKQVPKSQGAKRMLKRSRWMVGLICFLGVYALVACGTPTTEPKQGALQLTVALEGDPRKWARTLFMSMSRTRKARCWRDANFTVSPNMPAHGPGRFFQRSHLERRGKRPFPRRGLFPDERCVGSQSACRKRQRFC